MTQTNVQTDNATDVLEGTVWVTGVPRWLWTAVFLCTTGLALAGKIVLGLHFFGPAIYRLEQLPFAIWWGPLLIVSLLAGPPIVVLHGSRTWMRSYFPEVVALTWNGDGVELGDGRTISWREFKYIYMGFAKRREVLTIATDAFGPQTAIQIPKSLLLDPEQALDHLKRAKYHYMQRNCAQDVTSKMAEAQLAVKRRLIEAYGKTTSQLVAEGLPADQLGLQTYFACEEAKRAFGKPEAA